MIKKECEECNCFIQKEMSSFGNNGDKTRSLEFADCNGGGDFFKSHKLSPDGCIQIALQLAFSELLGRPSHSLETIDMRHYTASRLAIVYTHTEHLSLLISKLFSFSTTCRDIDVKIDEDIILSSPSEDVSLPLLFKEAVLSHSQLLKDTKYGNMENYLHLCFLTNEFHSLKNLESFNELCTSSSYDKYYQHDMITSNLGKSPGIRFVFSGLPVMPGLFIVGYMIKDKEVLFTITTCDEMNNTRLHSLISKYIIQVCEWTKCL